LTAALYTIKVALVLTNAHNRPRWALHQPKRPPQSHHDKFSGLDL